MLDYKLLEAFGAVIAEGGFERAARHLNLTQSAVSQRVRLLEDQYGQILLQRSSPPQPTPAGTVLLAHYRQVRQLENDLLLAREENPLAFAQVSIGVNADTLATWFGAAVEEILKTERIVLDIQVDDQDNTHELLQRGEVWGCVTTRQRPQQGCRSVYLGVMEYCLFATPQFAARWFPQGFTLQEAAVAPMALFNRKDDLNRKFFQLAFNRQPDRPPTFYIPSSEKYADFVVRGYCSGILPRLQAAAFESAGKIINLAPAHTIEVHLYWHCWNLKSPRMAFFDKAFVKAARHLLRTPSSSP